MIVETSNKQVRLGLWRLTEKAPYAELMLDYGLSLPLRKARERRVAKNLYCQFSASVMREDATDEWLKPYEARTLTRGLCFGLEQKRSANDIHGRQFPRLELGVLWEEVGRRHKIFREGALESGLHLDEAVDIAQRRTVTDLKVGRVALVSLLPMLPEEYLRNLSVPQAQAILDTCQNYQR